MQIVSKHEMGRSFWNFSTIPSLDIVCSIASDCVKPLNIIKCVLLINLYVVFNVLQAQQRTHRFFRRLIWHRRGHSISLLLLLLFPSLLLLLVQKPNVLSRASSLWCLPSYSRVSNFLIFHCFLFFFRILQNCGCYLLISMVGSPY